MQVVKEDRNPVLGTGSLGILFLGWDSVWVYHPCVLRRDGRYYMLYSGRGGIGIKNQIGLAISDDLVTWKKHPTNPVLQVGSSGEWDEGLVAHSYVIEKDDKYYMFYDGSAKKLWREEIGIGISRDLENWTKHPENPIFKINPNSVWEEVHVSRSCVIKEGDIYYLFYSGHDGTSERIGVAFSKDLIKWTRSLENPILELGEAGAWDEKNVSDPRVLNKEGCYIMFYSGYDSQGIGRMGLAFSKDLIKWTKFKGNPILDVGQDGEWDHIEACRADIQLLNGKYYLFYSGHNSFRYRIGLARIIGLESLL